jgi:hypothetical protein
MARLTHAVVAPLSTTLTNLMTIIPSAIPDSWPAEVELVAAPGVSSRIVGALSMPAIIDLRSEDEVRLFVTVNDEAEFVALCDRLPDVGVSLVDHASTPLASA